MPDGYCAPSCLAYPRLLHKNGSLPHHNAYMSGCSDLKFILSHSRRVAAQFYSARRSGRCDYIPN